MADQACQAVPLMKQLRSVPADAVLRIETPNALGCMDTRSIPVGRLCHEAADALGVEMDAEAQPNDYWYWRYHATLRELRALQATHGVQAPVVTDDMALAFHRATTDGDIGNEDVETIKAGLRAVFDALGVALPDTRERDALRMVLDIAQRRLLLPAEVAHVEALLAETNAQPDPGYSDEEVAALNEDERRNGPYGVSRPDHQSPAPTHADGESR